MKIAPKDQYLAFKKSEGSFNKGLFLMPLSGIMKEDDLTHLGGLKMKDSRLENQIPCIIENGIVYNLKDIYRVIRDMGHVHYVELIDEQVKASGEGYIMSVIANGNSATIIANKRLYLNVSGFDYLKIQTNEEGSVYFDLIHSFRTLRLIPVADVLGEDGSEEKPERFEDYDSFEQEDFAEIQLDDDDELIEGD